jgi:hypothetical protein
MRMEKPQTTLRHLVFPMRRVYRLGGQGDCS